MPDRELITFENKMVIDRGWAAGLTIYDAELYAVNKGKVAYLETLDPYEIVRLKYLGGICAEFSDEVSVDSIPEVLKAEGIFDLTLGATRARCTTALRLKQALDSVSAINCDRPVNLRRRSSLYELWVLPSHALTPYVILEPETLTQDHDNIVN